MVRLRLLLLMLAVAPFVAGQQPVEPVELIVRVNYSNPRAKVENVRVQVMTNGGATVSEKYVDSSNQVSFALMPGSYKLKFEGFGIESQETPLFGVGVASLMPGMQQTQTEMVMLRVTGESDGLQQPAPSVEHAISVAELNVPAKARKEFERGVEALEASELPKAEKHFRKAIELYPKYAMAYNNLGVLALKLNDRAQAKVNFEKANEIGSPASSINLAKLAAEDGEHQRAEELLAKAVALSPFHPEALLLLAREQLILGKLEQSLLNSRKVHDVPHAQFASAHLLAARVLETQNQPAEAILEYRMFLAEAPGSPAAARVAQSIAALESKLAQVR